MGVRPQMFHEIDKVEGVILDIEFTFGHGDVARVMPIGDIHLAVDQQRFHGRPQQRGIVARHRCHQQDFARLGFAARYVEMDQVAKGLFDHGFNVDQMVLAIFAGEGADTPIGFGNHALKRAFRDLPPGGHPLQSRVWHHAKKRVRCKGQGGGTQPLVRITESFHKVICRHVAHVGLLVAGVSRDFSPISPAMKQQVTCSPKMLHSSKNSRESLI